MKYVVINNGINLQSSDYSLPITDMLAEWEYWQNDVISGSSFELFCSEYFYDILLANNLANDIEFHTIKISKNYRLGWEGENIVLPKFYYMKPRGDIGKSEIIQMNYNLLLSENIIEKTKHLFDNVGFKSLIGELNLNTSNSIDHNSKRSFYRVKLEKNCKKIVEGIYFRTNRILFFKKTSNHICLTAGEPEKQNVIDMSMVVFSMEMINEIGAFEKLTELHYNPIEMLYENDLDYEIQYFEFYPDLKSIFIQNNQLYIQTELYLKIKYLLPETSIEYVLNINSYIAEEEQIGLSF
jgi:hypothetical protein